MATPRNCPECNTPLIQSDCGWVCPNGHGRIVPRVRDRQIKELADPIAQEWYGLA